MTSNWESVTGTAASSHTCLLNPDVLLPQLLLLANVEDPIEQEDLGIPHHRIAQDHLGHLSGNPHLSPLVDHPGHDQTPQQVDRIVPMEAATRIGTRIANPETEIRAGTGSEMTRAKPEVTGRGENEKTNDGKSRGIQIRDTRAEKEEGTKLERALDSQRARAYTRDLARSVHLPLARLLPIRKYSTTPSMI